MIPFKDSYDAMSEPKPELEIAALKAELKQTKLELEQANLKLKQAELKVINLTAELKAANNRIVSLLKAQDKDGRLTKRIIRMNCLKLIMGPLTMNTVRKDFPGPSRVHPTCQSIAGFIRHSIVWPR